MRISILLLSSFALMSVACVPTLVVIDRTTLIEEESSGDWPDLDKAVNQKAVDFRPNVLPPSATDKRKERAYQVIDGDYSLSTSSKR
ncbi:MAG: hypothetical protein FJY29_00775 [Betaproteobacteria bacterium]|nr:hypothetical protein [Betaproteobacteria bacterium]